MSTRTHHDPMHPHPVVAAYLSHLADLGRSPRTIATYRTALTRAQAELPAGLLAYPHELEHWLGTRASPSTRVVYRAAVRGLYAWARKRKLITDDPAAELEPVRRRRGVPRPATLVELEHILTTAAEPVRLWAILAAYAGTRCVEVARLDLRDVTEQTTYLHGKGGHERAVPTHPVLWDAVQGRPPGLVAGGRHPNRISQAAAAELDRIGLPDVTMHRLRHLAGTLWQAATGDIRVTQELLGHASVATTQIYTAVGDAAMRAAVMAVPNLAGSTRVAPGPGRAAPRPG